ncbi:hypothetical protein C5167_020492 [Papaver somniferum]|uniref:SWIM-type domain-containing protein n=1 Tax=Papaver somniferum TaxID=3469 RepID=A0A4Y7IW96_PAPSO|nr:hypothetical protein C5167_020492 [Papaver somniferum]
MHIIERPSNERLFENHIHYGSERNSIRDRETVHGSITAKCAVKECDWKFHATSIDERNEMFQVGSYNPEHICGAGGLNLNQKYSTSFTSSLIEEEVRKNPHKKLSKLQMISRPTMGLPWSTIRPIMVGKRETNPGSVIKFEFDHVKKQFQRIFIVFDACIKGYRFCRPMVYLDATFLTGRFRGCLMTATGINGGKVVGDGRPSTFLSDRHEGLLHGVPPVYPDSFHSLCYYHLKTNLPINGLDPRYTLVLYLFQEATYALSPENHAKAIQKIRDLNCDWVADYIETIPPESYENAYFKCCRYGRTSSTLAEVLNKWILIHKKIPASALLDQIRRKIMVMMADRHEIGANMMTPLTPEYEEKLEALQDEGLVWEVLVASPTVFEVFSESTHMVDLEHQTCACQRWRIYGFPCAHALAAIRKIKREAIDFISPYFTSDYFRKIYLHCIQSIPNYNRHVDIDENNTINPLIVKKQPGRPPGKRIIRKHETRSKLTTYLQV